MNHRLILACALVAAALAGCSTASKKPETVPVTTAPAPQPNTESASTNAGNTGSGMSADQLAAEQREAAEKALLSQLTVHFDFDQTVIHADDRTVLKAHARYLSKHPRVRVRLVGNTDERGTAEYNMALGERRAKAVREFLTMQGVKPSQLDVVSFGEEKPVDPGHTEEAWAKNRRVDLNYLNDAP